MIVATKAVVLMVTMMMMMAMKATKLKVFVHGSGQVLKAL
jgi:hypothetical protein